MKLIRMQILLVLFCGMLAGTLQGAEEAREHAREDEKKSLEQKLLDRSEEPFLINENGVSSRRKTPCLDWSTFKKGVKVCTSGVLGAVAAAVFVFFTGGSGIGMAELFCCNITIYGAIDAGDSSVSDLSYYKN